MLFRSFDNFQANKVARYPKKKIAELLSNPKIVRNKLKVNAAVINAKLYLDIQDEFGSFDSYIWQFVGGRTIQNSWKRLSEIPAISLESEAMSKELKKRGFKFVGPTICYAFMQAVGMVNDHIIDCHMYHQIKKEALAVFDV